MYLVSPDYLHRNESSATLQQPLQKQMMKKTKKTRARVKRKVKETKHPYDKWVAMRGEIAEAAVGRRALVKAIKDFIKVILPDTTLAQKVTSPKGTQTVRNLTRSLRVEPLPSTSSAGDVYEAETSPVSTSLSGARALAYDDDDDAKDVDTGVVSRGVETPGIGEDVTQQFARKSFGSIASPYLSAYVHKSGVLDAEYGLRKEGDKFYIGNSEVTVDKYSDFHIKDKHFQGTRGLWELLTRKRINKALVTTDDLKRYKSILNLTSCHLERYEPGAPYTSPVQSNSET